MSSGLSLVTTTLVSDAILMTEVATGVKTINFCNYIIFLASLIFLDALND